MIEMPLNKLISQREKRPSGALEVLVEEAVDLLRLAIERLRISQEMLLVYHEELAETTRSVAIERQRYKELCNFVPDGYLLTTTGGRIKEANRIAAELLLTPETSLVGMPLILFIDERERREFGARLDRLYQIPWKLEWKQRIQPQENDSFPARLSVGTESDSEGKPIGLRWIIRKEIPPPLTSDICLMPG